MSVLDGAALVVIFVLIILTWIHNKRLLLTPHTKGEVQ